MFPQGLENVHQTVFNHHRVLDINPLDKFLSFRSWENHTSGAFKY